MDDIKKTDVLEYAWKWFEYHAGQRLTAFRFFMGFLGALAVAFSQVAKIQPAPLVFIRLIAGIGSIAALAFFMLELRNEQLVNIGRNALKALEKDEFSTFPSPMKLFTADADRSYGTSYKLWIRLIYGLSMTMFLILLMLPRCFC